MKRARIRILPLLLAAVMLLSLLPVAAAEEADTVTGSISATVRIDYAQSLAALAQRDVQVELKGDKGSLGRVPLTKEDTVPLSGGYSARVSLRNDQGEPLDGGKWPGYLDVTFTGLPRGSYTLTFTGTGYKSYTTAAVEVQDYARQVTVGTGDATFTLGDVSRDGKVTDADRAAVAKALGTSKRPEIEQYDLNGDDKVDIVDLGYVSRQLKAQGEAEYQETALLGNPAAPEETRTALAEVGTTVSGDLGDLFTENGETVTFTSDDDSSIVIPLLLERSVEVSEVEIVTPVECGEVKKGTLAVETAGGETITVPFDHTLPEGIHAVGRTGESSVITIDLGKRVAVKKVTITVIKTGDNFAAVETVRFLKDIVPENPTPPNSTIKGLAAKAGSEQVSLTWQTLPNVSGYTVHCWPRSDSTKVQELRTSVNSAAVTGLENLTEYAFTVTPTDGSWTGQTSYPVYAVPQPSKAPAAPDMVSVGVLDSALSVAWKRSENATYYNVFYQVKGADRWTQAGGNLTSTGLTLNDLLNGTTYAIYVVAGNDLGKSGPSRTAEGTPKGVENKRPEGIPEAGLLSTDKIQSMDLADRGNYDAPSYSASRPWNSKNMWDNDYTTHWTASSNWSRNEHVVTTFKEPVDLTAAFWVPRLDGSYPANLRAYSVRVWYEGEDLGGEGHLIVPDPEKGGVDNGGTGRDVDTWPNVANYSTCAADRFAVLPFGPVENVKKISIAVEQRNYLRVSLSELLFMEYDPARSLPADIDALFVGGGDGLHTELVPGVKQEAIDALRARLTGDEGKYYLRADMLADELKLAESLLSGEGSRILLTGIDSRDGGKDSAKYGQGGSVLQPVGAAAGALSEITVYAAGIPEGETVTLYASQYNAEANAYLAEAGKLQNGRNVLTVPKIGSQNTPRGGSLYITYSGSNPENISLHVRRASDIPLLNLSGWYAMTDAQRADAIRAYVEELADYVAALKLSSANQTTDYRNVTEIAAPTVLLSLPASAALSGLGSADTDAKVRQLTSSILAWEDLMHICKTTQGIDNTYGKNDMQSRQNIRCMQMFTGAFMYAAGSHIGIGYGSCAGMVGGTPIKDLPAGSSANSLFGWGIAHEIGHNMDKLGKAEITNNIYAITVQTFDGKQNTLPSRLEKSNKYPRIFTKTAQATPGASGDVFTQLGMYWQLHLAYDGGEKPLDFYNRFFKAWKAGTYTKDMGELSYDEKVALTAAGTAERNLTEFFTRWGMALSAGVKEKLASYGAEERAVWYLSDQSRRDRLSGTGTLSGSFTASAAMTEGKTNEVTLTIDGSGLSGSLQGYEILRNGKSIDFVTAKAGERTVYTDLIGSANHRVFDYAVVAYSTLGTALPAGKNTQVDAGSVRIAYDAVLDSGTYRSERSGDTVTITLNGETAVSGLKLTGGALPEDGAYTVTVTDGAGKQSTAKTSTFDPARNEAQDDRDCYLLYFNKPGASAEDSRIWTYDAKTVVITGVPEGVTVLPVSYAGDDVAFLSGGAVGRLSADYDLGNGEKLSKGTLVITGTYRGDPLYNYVAVQGRFATAPDENGENEVVERPLSGDCYLFAEVPADGAVSDISNGIFLFVPNLKAEEQLQGIIGNCGAESLLPGQMKLTLYRTDKPNDTSSQRMTAETLWLTTPGGDTLPTVKLEGEA